MTLWFDPKRQREGLLRYHRSHLPLLVYDRATQILRQVRKNGAEYVVTYYGRPAAVLLPVDEDWLDAEAKRVAEAAVPGREVAAELEKLRQEIDRSWKSDDSAVELVNDQRP